MRSQLFDAEWSKTVGLTPTLSAIFAISCASLRLCTILRAVVVREELAPAPGLSGVSSRDGLEEGS
ncbi:hypothetical protein, partial [Bradyrhizobium sp. 33ap4]|uniref:hypothetical protein n=1 Tax=Bradyrhizobium sp. 33ap4 TaxID=3061630 RepID=UPI00292D343D